MGGPSQSTQNTQNALTQEQLGIAQQQNQLQQQNYQRMNQLEQPAISYYQGIAGGDAAQTTQAALAGGGNQLFQGFNSAKTQIMNNTAPGAARDMALANLEQNKDVTWGNYLTQTTTGAFDKLANLGAGLGSFSLQELGAAMGSLGGASSSNQALGQMQAEASPWNAIGGLLGDAMGMFGQAYSGRGF